MRPGQLSLWLFAMALHSSLLQAQTAPSGDGAPARSQTLTLQQAWRLAEDANPSLRAAVAGRMAAEGASAESRALLRNNPAVSYELNRRRVPQANAPADRYREWGMGVSQAFEIAGQSTYRRKAAQDDLAATDAGIAELRQQLRAEVEERFVRVLAVRRRIALEGENLKLVENAAQLMAKRVRAGESSRIDGNLARIEAERTRNQLSALDEQAIAALAELSQLLQLPAEARPELAGELTRGALPLREDLLKQADTRPQLAVLARRASAAGSRLALERASVYPDITLGLNVAQEGPTDLRERVVGVAVSIPLPLFRRNQAGIGRAHTELAQAQIEQQAGERDIRAAVQAQWLRHEKLSARARHLRANVLPPLEDNLRLSRIAFQEGEISLTELLLVNRQVLDGRRDMLDVETELRLTQIALERAAGVPPQTLP